MQGNWTYALRQIWLAAFLILVPVASFSAVELLQARSAAAANLGDLSKLTAIIADVQNIAAGGDLVAAEKRITDFETAWDEGEAGMKPLNPDSWKKVDKAADGALTALRADSPDAAQVKKTLEALQAALKANGSQS